jgi:hypothetical protein
MVRRAAPVAFAFALSGCGPTQLEVGSIVLQSLPIIVVLGFLIQWLYAAARERLGEETFEGLDVRPSLALLGASVALWAIAAARVDRVLPLEELAIGVALAGASYASILVVALWLSAGRRRQLSWAAAAPLAYLATPAFGLIFFGGSNPIDDWVLGIFIYPGFGGWVAGPLVAALFIEVGIRHLLKRKRDRDAEPPLPPARLV